MALPVSNKGIHLQYKGKPVGVMLILALSAALFGVMAVHKLREKRVLSTLLKERDRELYQVQILLQKERDQAREMKGKTQEMKDVIYTLSSQKTDLDAQILEMESSISSLKNEHQAMAMTLEERANEIETLHEKEMESQEASLREIIRLKEEEIENLTRHLESSTQASNALQDNMASPIEKASSENTSGGDQDNNNSSQNQKQTIMIEEVNEGRDQGGSVETVNEEENNGVDRGSTERETNLQVEEGSSELSAQPVRRSEVYTRRKRSKRLRAIARNRRMGKRRSRSFVRSTGEDQAQRDNEEEQSEAKAGITNQGFGSPEFGGGNEPGMIQDTVSKEEISSERRAEESHQDTQMGVEVASDVSKVKGAEGENTLGEGDDDSGKQPQYSDDAGSNNSEDQGENAGTREIVMNNGSSTLGEGDDDSGKQPQYSDDAGSNNSEYQGENAGTREIVMNDGNSPPPDQMENTNPIESSESSQETEDANQYEENDNWNSSQGTAEEKEEEKIDEPEF